MSAHESQGPVWRKSTRSNGANDNCVEVAFLSESIAVRDSKHPTGPVLVFSPDAWAAFVAAVHRGEYDRA